MSFDPYYQWLGIPPEEQPPHHYRLLGIKPLEENLDVIETAADRQMLHLRTYQSGKQAESSQALLNEISVAKIALLDPAKKSAYDAALKTKLAAAKPAGAAQTQQERPLALPATSYPAPPAPTPLAQRPLPVAVPLEPREPLSGALNEQSFPRPSAQRASPAMARRRSDSSMMLVAGGVVALVVLAVGGVIALSMLGNDQTEVVAQASTNTGGDDSGSSIEVERPRPVVPAVTPPEPVAPVVLAADEPEIPLPESVETDTPVDLPQEVDLLNKPVAESPTVESPATEPMATFGGSDTPKKLPVPEKGVREAKRQEILAIFPIADARTPEAKNQLAAKFIATARSSEADAEAQFALLNLAREQAAEAGDLKLAFAAIDLLAAKFDFDADAVRVTSVQQASKAVVLPAAKREIVVTGMSVVEQLVAADKFDEADSLSDKLLTLARPLRDNELTKSIVERRSALSGQAATYRRVQAAFDKLKTSPDDRDANLTAGRYLTFVKQDWDAGLRYLAKGSDELLAAAANGVLTSPDRPTDREKLADTWWEAAEREQDVYFKPLLTLFASTQYSRAIGDLSGIAKVKAENRIPELLRNPGCEEPVVNGQIRGWLSVQGGNWSQGDPEGTKFFFPPPSRVAEIQQVVDLTALASVIDAGCLEMQFRGHVRSHKQSPADAAQICLELFDSGGTALSTYDSGMIKSVDDWTLLADDRVAPKTTRYARVRLISTRAAGKSNDGYYDNLSLKVFVQPRRLGDLSALNNPLSEQTIDPANKPLGLVDDSEKQLTDEAKLGANPTAEPRATLSGIWRSSTGTVFQIADDGDKLDIRLFSSRSIESLNGVLLRDEKQLTKQQWQGVFKGDPKRRTWDLRIEAEVFDDDTILTNYEEITFDSKGGVIGRKFPIKGVLKRVRGEE